MRQKLLSLIEIDHGDGVKTKWNMVVQAEKKMMQRMTVYRKMQETSVALFIFYYILCSVIAAECSDSAPAQLCLRC